MRDRSTAWLAAGLAACAVAGCAGMARSQHPYVEAKDSLYVAMPVVAAAVDSQVAALGWAPGRFATELRKEVRYQLNRHGVATPDDSAQARSRMGIEVQQYASEVFAVKARLSTPAGTRDLDFRKEKGRAGEPEREDPTLDRIRAIVGGLVESARTDPSRKRATQQSNVPAVLLVF